MHEHRSSTTSMNVDHLKAVALLQGAYDLVGGLWPLLHMASFEAVTGPKTDDWLVRTVAGILVVVGVVLIQNALRGSVGHSVQWIAGGISLVLASVAMISSLAGFISWLYFFDGLIHLAFALAWGLHYLLRKRSTRTHHDGTWV